MKSGKCPGCKCYTKFDEKDEFVRCTECKAKFVVLNGRLRETNF